MTDARINLLGLTRPELEAFMVTLGEKPFRARQLMKWIYHEGVADFDAMTDLAKKFRVRLAEVAEALEQDPALGKELTYGTESVAPQLRIEYVADSGHWVQQEQPEQVSRLLIDFFRETPV